MKRFVAAGLLMIGFALPALGQSAAQATAHAPDGGVMQRLQSIEIPALTEAPFSAVVTTEWTKIMPDGTTATVKNRRTVARDSTGRVFEERRFFAPDGDTQPTRISNLQYLDPSRHQFYDCIPAEKTCYLRTDQRFALQAMPAGMTGTKACACEGANAAGMAVQLEALGQKTIEQVEVTGSREVTTIAAGQIGNEKPEPIVKEFWYSPRLGVNLVTKRFDPRSGIANFSVSHISLAEPDPRMFEPPAQYRIMRSVVEREGVAEAR